MIYWYLCGVLSTKFTVHSSTNLSHKPLDRPYFFLSDLCFMYPQMILTGLASGDCEGQFNCWMLFSDFHSILSLGSLSLQQFFQFPNPFLEKHPQTCTFTGCLTVFWISPLDQTQAMALPDQKEVSSKKKKQHCSNLVLYSPATTNRFSTCFSDMRLFFCTLPFDIISMKAVPDGIVQFLHLFLFSPSCPFRSQLKILGKYMNDHFIPHVMFFVKRHMWQGSIVFVC